MYNQRSIYSTAIPRAATNPSLPHPHPRHAWAQAMYRAAGWRNTLLESQDLFSKQNTVSVKEGWRVWVFCPWKQLIAATLAPEARKEWQLHPAQKIVKSFYPPKELVLLFRQLQSKHPFSFPLTLKGNLPMCGIRQLTQIQ